MGENCCNDDIRSRQKYFPWLKLFLERILKGFPNYDVEDLLQYLLKNVENEMNMASIKQDKKRLQVLFETVSDLYLHFWWKMHWKEEKMWKRYWKKDYFDVYSCNVKTKYYSNLLYYIIYLGILLSKGNPDSEWIKRVLQAINFMPGSDDIVYSSLLLIRKITKKYYDVYIAILRCVLLIGATKSITEPIVYIKLMMLFRRLKLCLEDKVEKKALITAALKFQVPSNLQTWLSSLNLEVSSLKQENFARQLLCKKSPDLFKTLQKIIADSECLKTEGHFEEEKYEARNCVSYCTKSIPEIKSIVEISKRNQENSQKCKNLSKSESEVLYNRNKHSKRKKKKKRKALKKEQMPLVMNFTEGHPLISNAIHSDNLSSSEIGTFPNKNKSVLQKCDGQERIHQSGNNHIITESSLNLEYVKNKSTLCPKNGLSLSLGHKFSVEDKKRKRKLDHNVNPLEDTQVNPSNAEALFVSNASFNLKCTSDINISQNNSINSECSPKKKNRILCNKTVDTVPNKMSSSPEIYTIHSKDDFEILSCIKQMLSSVDAHNACDDLGQKLTNSLVMNSEDTLTEQENGSIITDNSCKELHKITTPGYFVSLVDIKKIYPANVVNTILKSGSLNTSFTLPNSPDANKDAFDNSAVSLESGNNCLDINYKNNNSLSVLGNGNQNCETESDVESFAKKKTCLRETVHCHCENGTQTVHQPPNLNGVSNVTNEDAIIFPIPAEINNKTPDETHANSESSFSNEYEKNKSMNTNGDNTNITSFVINCNLNNVSSDYSFIGAKPKNSDNASIKIVINLNNSKPVHNVPPSNENIFENVELSSNSHISKVNFVDESTSFQSVAMPSSSAVSQPNTASNPSSVNAFTTSSIPVQSEMETSLYPKEVMHTPFQNENENISIKKCFEMLNKTNYFFSPQKQASNGSPRKNFISGTELYKDQTGYSPAPQKSNFNNLSKNNFANQSEFHKNQSGNMWNETNFFSPLKRNPNMSSKNNSADGSKCFGASDYESDWSLENISFVTSQEQNCHSESELSQSLLPQSNVQAVPNQQNCVRNLSSTNILPCTSINSTENNSELTESASYRNCDIYSDMSEDEFTVSTLSILSDEETDHSLVRTTDCDTTPECVKNINSGLKVDAGHGKNIRNKNQSVSNKVCGRNKKLHSKNLNCESEGAETKEEAVLKVVPKRAAPRSLNKSKHSIRKTATEKNGIDTENHGYNLRVRKRISLPTKLIDYIV